MVLNDGFESLLGYDLRFMSGEVNVTPLSFQEYENDQQGNSVKATEQIVNCDMMKRNELCGII